MLQMIRSVQRRTLRYAEAPLILRTIGVLEANCALFLCVVGVKGIRGTSVAVWLYM